MNIQVILTVTVLLTLTLAAGVPTIASAQYYQEPYIDEKTGANTLEEVLKIKREQVKIAWPVSQYDGPMLEPPPHRMLVFMVAALLGGIGAIFFIKGRSGKYAAIGKG